MDDLQRFVGAHGPCGTLTGDATAPVPDGYLLWIACSCGVVFERWVTPEAAEEDLLRSRLATFPN
jgi:hypothetical protein